MPTCSVHLNGHQPRRISGSDSASCMSRILRPSTASTSNAEVARIQIVPQAETAAPGGGERRRMTDLPKTSLILPFVIDPEGRLTVQRRQPRRQTLADDP